MREPIHDKVVKEMIQELVVDPDPFVENLVNNYLQDLQGQAQLLLKSGSKVEDLQEHYLQELRGKVLENVVEAFIKSSEFKDSLYKKTYERLKALGDEGISYGDLFKEIYQDVDYLNEIFVRLVEETEVVAITSAKQLQELTGITHLDSWDIKTREYITPKSEEEAIENANKEVEDTFIKAMKYRYSKALEDILKAGGKYSELLQVKPSYFNLPETWSGSLTKNQYSSILWAINFSFKIGENSSVRPDLKTIAQEIDAPYSVLMDAHKTCNF
jgi:hypothetical protein